MSNVLMSQLLSCFFTNFWDENKITNCLYSNFTESTLRRLKLFITLCSEVLKNKEENFIKKIENCDCVFSIFF